MAKPKLIAVLAPETCAYVAGLIDGEETMTLRRGHSSENRRLVGSIANTELALPANQPARLDRCRAGTAAMGRRPLRRHCPGTPSLCRVMCKD